MKSHWIALGLIVIASAGHAAEQIPAGEDAISTEIANMVADQVRKAYSESKDAAHRDVHVKAHGCVRAEFEVLADIPANLKVGVFKKERKFPAWIRYSNGSGRSQKDSVGDGRGMAIKLMGVEGEKILADEKDAKTQDFVMINHPVFFVRNVTDYLELQKVLIQNGSPTKFFFPGVNPAGWRLHEAKIAAATIAHKVSNPLSVQYWSITPFQLGAQQEIKFTAVPCAESANGPSQREGEDFLRDNMKAQLASGSACFDFLIQTRSKPSAQPIEDPTIEWKESDSPYVRVARIHIAKQEFLSAEQQTACENLSFTPWHSLPEHRPLGGINRSRKIVYDTISKARHDLNGVKREEPTGF